MPSKSYWGSLAKPDILRHKTDMLTVIIPTLNSAQNLQRLLDQIGELDVIISDGGSVDETVKIAVNGGARLALGHAGRGAQLSRGVELALASMNDLNDKPIWLLCLHADSELPAGWQGVTAAHIRQDPDKAAYFGFALNDQGFWPWLVQVGVALRCKLFALPYGDQGLLIRSDLYRSAGGYPDGPLFEDVTIIRALKQQNGRASLKALPAIITTDARRYKARGYMRQIWANLNLLRRYFLGADIAELAQTYRQQDKVSRDR